MDLVVAPPVTPMLASLARTLPDGDVVFEPKWDGFRCLAFRAGDDVDLRSRHDRPLARYFPEIVEALHTLAEPRLVLDGEILVATATGPSFTALMERLHPAPARVALLREQTPASFFAFDLLSAGDRDLRGRPFAERRETLAALLEGAPAPVRLTPATRDRALAARWLDAGAAEGIDGVVAKDPALGYRPGARAMVKVKREHTADCVAAGVRADDEGRVTSLLLGLYDGGGTLRHVGVASSFSKPLALALARDVAPLVAPLEDHPWEHGFLAEGGATGRLKGAAGRWQPGMRQDWVPLAPARVCEVVYGQLDGHRFRHPGRFRRWRPDRDPRSCSLDQLSRAA